MPALLDFPNLSSLAAVKHGKVRWERPNEKLEYENGAEEVRTTTSRGRFKAMPVRMSLREEDFQTVFEFLDARGLEGEPFYYTHPLFGRGLVRYANSEMEIDPIAFGPPAWYRIEFELRGQFYGA